MLLFDGSICCRIDALSRCCSGLGGLQSHKPFQRNAHAIVVLGRSAEAQRAKTYLNFLTFFDAHQLASERRIHTPVICADNATDMSPMRLKPHPLQQRAVDSLARKNREKFRDLFFSHSKVVLPAVPALHFFHTVFRTTISQYFFTLCSDPFFTICLFAFFSFTVFLAHFCFCTSDSADSSCHAFQRCAAKRFFIVCSLCTA